MSLTRMLRLSEPVMVSAVPVNTPQAATSSVDQWGQLAIPHARMLIAPFEQAAPPPSPGDASPIALPDAKSRTASITSATEKVATYIPSEVLALYLILVGLVAPTTDSGRWGIYVAVCALLVAYVGLAALLAQKAAKAADGQVPDVNAATGGAAAVGFKRRNYLIAMVISLVAFTTYAVSVPGSPFTQLFDDRTTKIGGIAVLVGAILLPMIADLFDFPNLERNTAKQALADAQAGA